MLGMSGVSAHRYLVIPSSYKSQIQNFKTFLDVESLGPPSKPAMMCMLFRKVNTTIYSRRPIPNDAQSCPGHFKSLVQTSGSWETMATQISEAGMPYFGSIRHG